MLLDHSKLVIFAIWLKIIILKISLSRKICLLKHQLQHYELDVTKYPDFQNMGIISELCRGLEITGKSKFYRLIDRLIRLVLTLPISTETTE